MNIQIPLESEWKENDRYWTFCVGSGHAALALRHDYQEILAQVVKDLGFQRVRFHGLFNDDMQVVTRFYDLLKVPKSKHVKTTSFYQIACIYDRLLEIGIKPFVEIGFMPSALAKSKKTVFYYKGNISMPKKQEEWCTLLKEFIQFLIERYGKEEVATWYFEIWNEPDLKGFFFQGSKQDYFDLYKMSVEALRSVLPNAIVGGPSTSQNRWVEEFRIYCQKEHIPLDFLSTHHYPGDDIGLPLITLDNIKRLLCSAKQNQDKSVQEVFYKMMVRNHTLPLIKKDSMYKQLQKVNKEANGVPLLYTEWNVNPTCTNELHDHCASATYIIKHVLDGQYLMQGCSFWTFSDIFEENSFFTKPFSGTFGLTNIHGIPKPSYWAFHFLHQLGEQRLQLPITHNDVEYAVFQKGETLQILLYTQAYVHKDIRHDITLQIPTKQKFTKVTRQSINEEDCNPRKLWEENGAKTYLSKEEVAYIKEHSKPTYKEIQGVYEQDMYCLRMTLQCNEVVLLQCERDHVYE